MTPFKKWHPYGHPLLLYEKASLKEMQAHIGVEDDGILGPITGRAYFRHHYCECPAANPFSWRRGVGIWAITTDIIRKRSDDAGAFDYVVGPKIGQGTHHKGWAKDNWASMDKLPKEHRYAPWVYLELTHPYQEALWVARNTEEFFDRFPLSAPALFLNHEKIYPFAEQGGQTLGGWKSSLAPHKYRLVLQECWENTRLFLHVLRESLPGVDLVFSTYARPDLHSDFPFAAYAEREITFAPQSYWSAQSLKAGTSKRDVAWWLMEPYDMLRHWFEFNYAPTIPAGTWRKTKRGDADSVKEALSMNDGTWAINMWDLKALDDDVLEVIREHQKIVQITSASDPIDHS